MHASLVTPQKTTPQLTKMGTETVKWYPKDWDVKHIADEKTLTLQRNNGSPTTKDQGKIIVTHSKPKAADGLVRDESTVVRDHVVSGAGISHNQAERSTTARGRGGFQQRLNQDGREDNVVN
jgi:hypothetical protein